jgi:hypothetical protein
MSQLEEILRGGQGWTHELSMSLARMADNIERAVVAAAGIDAKHAGTSCRFHEYVGPLREAGAFDYPRSTLWKPGSREMKLFIEGGSQAWGLWKATRIWPGLPEDVAKESSGSFSAAAPYLRRRKRTQRGSRLARPATSSWSSRPRMCSAPLVSASR